MRIKKLKSLDIFLLMVTVMVFIILYVIQLENYLLFHLFAEIFSIIIASCVFIIVWNGRSFMKDNYLFLLGIAYLFIGFIDLLHTFGYTGMNIFSDYDYYANQFWIAGRGMEAVTLLVGSFLIGIKRDYSVIKILLVYFIVTIILIYSIIFSDVFPECFVEGSGQTLFKIVSEYIIICILFVVILNMFRRRRQLASDIFIYLILSIVFTILSELAFTFYISNYGFSNMVGHYTKIISFYFIYRVVVRKNIIEPYDSIFRGLTQQKNYLDKANELKTHLFSIISHDLTSTTSGIAGLSEALDDDFNTISAETQKEYISELSRSAKNLSGLVENLLTWSRLELTGYDNKKEKYDLEKLLNGAVDMLWPNYRLKKVELRNENQVGIKIKVNRDTFSIIIRNILSNALKFSEPGTCVHISSVIDEKIIEISIRDEGRGMVFTQDMFLNPVNESSLGTGNEKGSGLGLYIIKKYVDKNDGTVKIKSTPGSGTTVILSFPAYT